MKWLGDASYNSKKREDPKVAETDKLQATNYIRQVSGSVRDVEGMTVQLKMQSAEAVMKWEEGTIATNFLGETMCMGKTRQVKDVSAWTVSLPILDT